MEIVLPQINLFLQVQSICLNQRSIVKAYLKRLEKQTYPLMS
jgi:hypothetical protein